MIEIPTIGSRVIIRHQRDGVTPAAERHLGDWPYVNGATGTVIERSSGYNIVVVRYDNPPPAEDRDVLTFAARLEYHNGLSDVPKMCRAAMSL